MCGCFTRHHSRAEIHACLNLIGPAINLQARYNVAPSQEAGVESNPISLDTELA